MQRRTFATFAATGAISATGLMTIPANAQQMDLSDAINKAGRQRMLSQRMGKAWLALSQNVEKSNAQLVLDKSITLFDSQLAELKGFAPTPDILNTYNQLGTAWLVYKTALRGSAPTRDNATALLQLDAKVLALAHQGTVQYEAALAKSAGKLVNMAGRQRMLSQRMAKFYLASTFSVDPTLAAMEIDRARNEFTSAMDILRNGPEATSKIKDELMLADAQWVFFDLALQKLQKSPALAQQPMSMSHVFVTSENLLAVMDRVTGMYTAIKV